MCCSAMEPELCLPACVSISHSVILHPSVPPIINLSLPLSLLPLPVDLFSLLADRYDQTEL
jgi:hypothetical protein